jgi:hypothetical protein
MHILYNWSAKRSGPQMTVRGYEDERCLGQPVKFSVVEIRGPSKGRMVSPASSIGVMRNGDVIALI